jgi:chromate transport protein ChrA
MLNARNTSGLREFIGYLADSRTELAIVAASAGLVLVLADSVLMVLLAALVPEWYALAVTLDRSTRRWIVGGPLALAFLLASLWRMWRQAAAPPKKRRVRMASVRPHA